MDQVSATASTLGFGERMAHRLLTRSPLGLLVRWVAEIQASVHAKLLGGFLLVVLLFMAMGALSLQTIARMSRQSQLLHQAHERVDSSRQIEHALAMQMNFIAMALLLKDEHTIANFLRENNRFNDMLARLEEAAPPEEGQMIQRIHTAQDEILTTVADIANLIRDGKVDEAMTLQLKNGYPQYQQIDGLVNQVVKTEEDKMGTLSRIVTAEALYGPMPRDGFDMSRLRFTAPYNFNGAPTLSVPCGVSHDGLPFSLQFVGKPLGEALLCRIGHAYEQATEWHTMRPPM